MATVNRGKRREEALQLRHSLPHPPVLKEAGGQQLDEPRASLLHPSVRGPSGAKERREFGAQGANALDWLQNMESILSEKLQISAERNTLMEQVSEFEPTYNV